MSKTVAMSVEEWYKLIQDGASINAKIQLAGDSMEPLVRKNRDFVTVCPLYRELKIGDIVLFHRSDGAFVVHRVRALSEDRVITLGDNCFQNDAPHKLSEIYGLITKIERGKRVINTDSKRARLYGRFRMATLKFRIAKRKLKAKLKAILKPLLRK